MGKFPFLVKKFHEEWMSAEIRTRMMLSGVKAFPRELYKTIFCSLISQISKK
jgi:hypothetical protein